MLNVLFVDDDEKVLNGLQRSLRSRRSEWTMSFVSSAEDALEIMRQGKVDVVVTDMDLGRKSGIELLEDVRDLFPEAVRLVLSGSLDEESFLLSMRAAHRYLQMPCESEDLTDTVQSATFLRDLLRESRLIDVTARLTVLPSRPVVYQQILQETRSPDSTLERVGEIVGQDPAMTAKLLQLVNSAYFGLPQTITNAEDAACMLGLDAVKALVLSVETFSGYQGDEIGGISIEAVWERCIRVGSLARAVARAEGAPEFLVEDSALAGMLHDAGVLVLALNQPERLEQARRIAEKFNLPTHETERRVLGVSHAEIGAYLMAIWGLPVPVVNAIAFHHRPSDALLDGFSELTAVHVADAAELALAAGAESLEEYVDLAYLEALGLSGRLDDWFAACSAVAPEEAA